MPCHIEYAEPSGEKATDLAVEALKQLLALGTGTLALTIAFLKDALGDERTHAKWSILVPLSWGALLISAWCGWVAMADAARFMSRNGGARYVFAEGRTRTLARIAQWTFLAGLTLLGSFAIKNYALYFRAGVVLRPSAPAPPPASGGAAVPGTPARDTTLHP